MTTGANALPTLNNNAANLNLNTWTLLSDVLGVNDTDGDTIQAIRFENTGTDTLSYSLSKRAYLDSNVSYDLPSLKDVYVRGHTSFAEETIRVQLYDGYEWGEWTDVTMTSGTNVAPELRSVSDNSLIQGTLNTTIRTNERRALSEYISYYDDPNDDDNNLPTSVKVRTTGATGLGIEVNGVVTNLDSAIEQSFAIESLDDIFVVGNADPNLYTPDDIILEVKIENSELNFYLPGENTPYTGDFIEGVTYRFDLSDESNKFTGYAEPRFLTVHSEGDSVDFSADGVSYTQYIGTYPDDGITRSDSVSGVSGSFAEVTIPTTEVSGGGLLFYGEHREEAGNPAYYKWLPSTSDYNAVIAMDTIEVAVSDGYGWSEWTTLNMTTGANNLATVTSSTTLTDLNLNQWYLLSDLITVNDADGDTIQSIRVAGDDYGPGNIDVYSVSQRGYLDGSDTLNELPSLSDLYMRGTSAFVEAQFTLELYDGIEWSTAENMSFTFGTNLAPELRSVTDDSVIEGTLNTTIRTNERRALSEYISYWDSPSDDDGSNTPSAINFNGVNGNTNLGIEIDGVVTSISNNSTILNINSLDDVFIVGAATTSSGAESFEIELFDNGGASTGKVQLDMTTGANALPTLNNNAANLNLNTWTLLSDVLGVNDTDGDTIQAIRFENTGTDTLSYSLSKRAYLDSNVSYDLPSLKDVYVRGHTSFAEETIRVQLYDGYEWGEWTDVTMTSGTNVAPELRSVSDNSLIQGTLNTTIRTNERRALSEYISYYDDPNDDDNNLPTSVKVRTTGATGLGIEVDGVVTNLDSAIEQSFAIESLDDIFVVGNAVASGAESIEIAVADRGAWTQWVQLDMTTGANALPTLNNNAESLQTMLKVKAENGKFILYKPDNTLFEEGFVKGITYNIDISDSSLTHHPFKLSATADGTHNGGVSLTDIDGVASSGDSLIINIPKESSINELYYYCNNHSGMGSSITMFNEPKVQLNLNTWTLLSDVLGVNDTDGDTIQAIRFENTGTDTLSYSLSKRAYLDSNVSYDLPSLKDVYVRGHTSFAEETIRVQLYDGYEWGEWTDVTMTSGTNVAPELRSVSDNSLIQGTLNTTIRTNERRALSEYISYYDDPNDDDNNLPTSVKVRTTGATGLGIEVNGVVTNLDSAIEQSFAIESLDDIFVVGNAVASGAESIEIAVADRGAWTQWVQLDMTTGANALPTLNNNAANLNLNTWTLLSDVLGVNDTDGDTIQAIRFENTGTDTLSYSLSKRAYLDSNVSYDLPSLKDVYVRGHTSFAEETIRVQLYDGYEWGEWTDVTMTSGTNVAPELRSVSDNSLIQGTLNTTIRTNERRALSEYISYYDDPNDDDNNLPTSVKVRTTGATGLGIEVNGVVTNLDSAIEQSFAIESLDDIFVVGNAVASGAESIEIAVADRGAWTQWVQLDMTTGANNLATVTSSTTLTDLNLNQWYLLSDLITVNDADGDTIQSIRVAGDDYGPGNIDVYSVSQRGYLDGSDTLNELPSLSDLYMRGTSAFVEAQFTLELYDGIEWSTAENMSFTFGTNLAPELRSVTDDSVIEGTLNTTIRTNERRALSEYISYWDSPSDDDGSNTPSAINFNGVNGNTNLGIEIDGVVTSISNNSTILNINSLDDVFIVGAATTSSGAESFEIELFDNGGASTGKVQLDMTIEPENNTNPELRSVNDDSVIEGTLNTTIRADQRRALSEYISYYDDPNDDDNNLPTSVKVRTTGATGLGIEVNGVVTNLDSAVEQSFAIESLDNIFVVGNADPNLYTPDDIILEVKIENSELNFYLPGENTPYGDFIEGVTYRFDL